MEWINAWGLWGLFLSAFLSSTLLPGSSEVLLLTLAHNSPEDKMALLVVATLGNTLGGMSSWLIGWIIARRFPARELAGDKPRVAVDRLRRWGSPVLLLSWVPVIGDPLCVAAGWLRIHGLLALIFIGMGKFARYAALLALV